MSRKIRMFETKSKQAIFINAKQFSDYEYDETTYDIRHGEIYGIKKGLKKEIVDSYYDVGVGILITKDMEKNEATGLLSYYGDVIIPFGEYNNIRVSDYGRITVQKEPGDKFKPYKE